MKPRFSMPSNHLGVLNAGAIRRFGIVLLLVGFGWLVTYQVGVELRGSRPALQGTLVQLDQQPSKSYSKQEVAQLLREAGVAQYESTPVFLLPAALMLIGGLMSFTRSSSPAEPPNCSIEPAPNGAVHVKR